MVLGVKDGGGRRSIKKQANNTSRSSKNCMVESSFSKGEGEGGRGEERRGVND